MALFEEKENRVIISPEFKLIPEFKEVLKRDRDPEKRGALQVLAYIYFMYDYRSPYSKYGEEERSERLVKDLSLGDKWKPDSTTLSAKQKYLELQETPTIKTLRSIRDGLIVSSQAIDNLSRNITDSISDDDDVEGMVKMVTSLLSIADKLPKVVESISSLEEKIKKEQSTDTKLRGGGSKGMFED
jgi:hypothetical protein